MQALPEDDGRLRLACEVLTKSQLRLKSQQLEIDELLEFVRDRGNKSLAGKSRVKNVHSVVGLSANQVGIMKHLCVVDLSIGRRGYHDLHVLVNAQVVWSSKAQIYKNEGCVNFPMTRGVTTRSKSVTVEAWDRSGNELRLKLRDWPAVLLQHEVDHLNGRLFIDRLLDPTQADLVKPGQYEQYRAEEPVWAQKIDVSHKAR